MPGSNTVFGAPIASALAVAALFVIAHDMRADGPSRPRGSIDLLAATDVKRDAVFGTWGLRAGALQSDATRAARLQLPYEPPREYDLAIVLTRKSGDGAAGPIVVAADRQFTVELAGFRNKVAGLQFLDGHSANDAKNPTKRPLSFVNGRRYSVVVRVRREGIQVLVNGKALFSHRTDGSDLRCGPDYAMPGKKQLGLYTWKSIVVFHEVRVREVSGTGRLLLTKARTSMPASPEIMGCKCIAEQPLSYRTEHFIVQAAAERIEAAVGWAKFVDETIYPTMLEVLGYTPRNNLHVLQFTDDYDYPKNCPCLVEGYGKTVGGVFYKHASRIYVKTHKLNGIPPYQRGGGIVWETIHGLLNEAKEGADWKPIYESELLDLIFEMEVYKRLKYDRELDHLWRDYVDAKPNSRYAALGKFWKQHGWDPIQKLLIEFHKKPEVHPTLDESTFAFYMSVASGKDVTGFFEAHGWSISADMKNRIRRQLQQNR